MKLYLNWKTREPNADAVNLYRSTEPIGEDVSSLTPIAVLPGGTTSYVDDGLTRGVRYYYRTEVVKGALKALSPLSSFIADTRHGPGQNVLAAGDFESGYFSTETNYTTNLPSARQINTALGYSIFSAFDNTSYFKFACKGKILYVPWVGTGVSFRPWVDLYAQGLIWGENGPGPFIPNGVAQVNQLRTITFGADTFIVRLMRGAVDPLKPFNFTLSNEYYYEPKSEFDLTLGRINSKVSRSTYPGPKLMGGDNISPSNYTWMFAEADNSFQLARGTSGNQSTLLHYDAYWRTVGLTTPASGVQYNGASYSYCVPMYVLEWVPRYEPS